PSPAAIPRRYPHSAFRDPSIDSRRNRPDGSHQIEIVAHSLTESDTTKGPSETQIAERLAPYRCFLSVCYGMPQCRSRATRPRWITSRAAAFFASANLAASAKADGSLPSAGPTAGSDSLPPATASLGRY